MLHSTRLYLNLILITLLLPLTSCDQLLTIAQSTGGSTLTTADVARGLKEALTKGALEGAKQLSSENGYLVSPYKILLPPEAQKVVNRVSTIPGFSNLEKEIITKVNRAAENAAKAAGPIFVSAIKQMTVRDAWDILMGSDNAATDYLKKTTTSKLYQAFRPEIKQSLNKFGAIDLWNDVVTRYNSIPLVKNLNPNLDDYVTDRALEGLYSEIAKMEKDIRENPVERTSALLRRVFAKQD